MRKAVAIYLDEAIEHQKKMLKVLKAKSFKLSQLKKKMEKAKKSVNKNEPLFQGSFELKFVELYNKVAMSLVEDKFI